MFVTKVMSAFEGFLTSFRLIIYCELCVFYSIFLRLCCVRFSREKKRLSFLSCLLLRMFPSNSGFGDLSRSPNQVFVTKKGLQSFRLTNGGYNDNHERIRTISIYFKLGVLIPILGDVLGYGHQCFVSWGRVCWVFVVETRNIDYGHESG